MPFTNLPYVSLQTTSYTLLMSDEVVDFAITTAQTATLPTAASVTGKRFTIKNLDTSTAATILTINTTSAQTIDGRASGSIKLSPRDFIQVISDGVNWKVIIMQETVVANYGNFSTPSGSVSTTSGDTIQWSVSEIDTHSGMSAGTYTVQVAGLYDIFAQILGSTTNTNPHYINIRIYKNASPIKEGGVYFETTTAARAMYATVFGSLRLAVGDTILINCVAAFGQVTYNANALDNFVQIKKVGN